MNKPEREGFVENEAFELDDVNPRPRPLKSSGSVRQVEPPKPEPKIIEPEPEPAPSEIKAEAPKPRAADTWPLIIPLTHKKIAVEAEGSKPARVIDELTLREPTAGDIAQVGGNPVRIEVIQIDMTGLATFNIVIDDKKMMGLISQLSGVMLPFLNRMDPRDYNSVAYRLRRFFIPEQGLW